MSFRLRLYSFLVNRKPGIQYRYHKVHDGSRGLLKLLSWIYLLLLNLGCYVLQLKFIGNYPKAKIYESKRLPVGKAESEIARNGKHYKTVQEMTDVLSKYEVISFDMFDTLVFRPLSEPADVFFFVGENLGIPDFKNIRRQASAQARRKKYLKEGHTEVTLREIWNEFEIITGTDAETGMQAEIEAEKNLCYANPFMLEVWEKVKAMGKRIIVVSDMYVSSADLEGILLKNGFGGAEKIYVSCEHASNKAKGDLFDLVKKELGSASVIHVGDNPASDGTNAKKSGFPVCRYPQANRNMLLYRPYDMSAMVGSAYRGIVSNHLYNGTKIYSSLYEYGFIYGGLFVLGYCDFIHEQAKRLNADKLFFLSRDGDILKKVYDRLFPQEKTEYIYWSRRASLLLMADENRHDYFRRFVFHKVNQKYTIEEILTSMDLGFLTEKLSEWPGIWREYVEKTIRDQSKRLPGKDAEEKLRKAYDNEFIVLDRRDELTNKNASALKRFIEHYWKDVIKTYAPGHETAKNYFKDKIGSSQNILAIDIGWAGSGALLLSHLVEKTWNMPCRITGMVAGTNTVHNSEPDASEGFLQSGKLISYMYSQSHNRDLLKKHDPNKDHNVYWEMLLSSEDLPFAGFYSDGLRYGMQDVSADAVKEIRSGIEDFISLYTERFKAYPYMMNISGRDAYAPMLLAESYGAKYLKRVAEAVEMGHDQNVK